VLRRQGLSAALYVKKDYVPACSRASGRLELSSRGPAQMNTQRLPSNRNACDAHRIMIYTTRPKMWNGYREEQDLRCGAVRTALIQEGFGRCPAAGDMVYFHFTVRAEASKVVVASTLAEHGGSGCPHVAVLEKGLRIPRAWELVLTGGLTLSAARQSLQQGCQAQDNIRRSPYLLHGRHGFPNHAAVSGAIAARVHAEMKVGQRNYVFASAEYGFSGGCGMPLPAKLTSTASTETELQLLQARPGDRVRASPHKQMCSQPGTSQANVQSGDLPSAIQDCKDAWCNVAELYAGETAPPRQQHH
jgi:hypothetical protein